MDSALRASLETHKHVRKQCRKTRRRRRHKRLKTLLNNVIGNIESNKCLRECISQNNEVNESSNTDNSRHMEMSELRHSTRVLRDKRFRLSGDFKNIKCLLTPEIKSVLKGWLIRHRDNPYPNREEKKDLAKETGLTYMQVCNWFANWRRKLKNTTDDRRQATWGYLIRHYNDQAKGNVEQLSISSEDTIWGEQDLQGNRPNTSMNTDCSYFPVTENLGKTSSAVILRNSYQNKWQTSSVCVENTSLLNLCPSSCSPPKQNILIVPQIEKTNIDNVFISNTTDELISENELAQNNGYCFKTGDKTIAEHNNNYKDKTKESDSSSLLQRWLESAAKYQPSSSYVPWTARNITWKNKLATNNRHSGTKNRKNKKVKYYLKPSTYHHRKEIDAAEALACLSNTHH